MQHVKIKETAHQLIEQLPDNVTWDDVVYKMVVRRSIEIGIEQSDMNDVVDTETVRAEFNLTK